VKFDLPTTINALIAFSLPFCILASLILRDWKDRATAIVLLWVLFCALFVNRAIP
jgi:hypothetical protein